MEKTVNYYVNLPYTVELRHDTEEGWFVRVKELRGCMSEGDTAEEAVAMIQEAMALWLEVALEEGIPIPEPLLDMPRFLHRELAEESQQKEILHDQGIPLRLGPAIIGEAQAQVVELGSWFDAGAG